MKITDSQIYEIIKIVLTALISIAATLFATSCTASLSVFKNNSGSRQGIEQSTRVDSLMFNPQIFR